jgi:6-phosphofructokinase 1
MAKVGILTGGGDCPGLNSVIRAAVRKGLIEGYGIVGIKNGWKGLIENEVVHLSIDAVSGILPKGGTILGTSRTNPYMKEGAVEDLKANYKKLGLEALIVVGGEDTLGVAAKLIKNGVTNIVGVPKTIDNDLSGTDYTFGFDTALNTAMECIDRLHSTAESHHRIMVVEVMGRHAGWIAIESGISGGADIILIPELPIDIEEVCSLIKKRHNRGKTFSIIVVAEGAQFKQGTVVIQEEKLDEFGHVRLGGIGDNLAREIEKRTGYETRVSVLGYIQRGGSPTAFDRILGTRFGVKAVELVKDKKFGRMVALSGLKIIDVPIEQAVKQLKTVDMELYEIAKVFFG